MRTLAASIALALSLTALTPSVRAEEPATKEAKADKFAQKRAIREEYSKKKKAQRDEASKKRKELRDEYEKKIKDLRAEKDAKLKESHEQANKEQENLKNEEKAKLEAVK